MTTSDYFILLLFFIALILGIVGIIVIINILIDKINDLSYKVRCLVRTIDNCNALDEDIRKSMIDEDMKK